MELFRNLRLKVGRSTLARKSSKIRRRPFYKNFKNVKSIGLVWDASRPEDFILLSRFHQKMSELNIDFRIFGFFPGKVLPDQFTAVRFLTCLKKNELDIFYRPDSPDAMKFADNKFDVLIDVNFQKLFPLVYVTTLSQSRLKVGLTDTEPEKSPFDLMISLKKPVNLESYLEQVILYLDMINSESSKKAV
jgi:hypothetical protein